MNGAASLAWWQIVITICTFLILVISVFLFPVFRAAARDRKQIIDSVGAVGKLVAAQNGRVGKLEEWKVQFEKREEFREERLGRVEQALLDQASNSRRYDDSARERQDRALEEIRAISVTASNVETVVNGKTQTLIDKIASLEKSLRTARGKR